MTAARRLRVLIVDLNNFALYPSIAIGYLTAVLRQGGFETELLAPLARGITGVAREPRPPWWGVWDKTFRWRTGVTRSRLIRAVRARYTAYSASKLARARHELVAELERRLDDGFDAVLVSTYLMYRPHCVEIGKVCERRGVPMILGGPYFAARDVAREWIDLPGLSALVGGEVEPHLCEIVRAAVAREPMAHIPGVWQTQAGFTLDAPPLTNLDALPFADYSLAPWDKYPRPMVPMITGRGCGWGVCTFCSDVASTVGRTFRSRSPDNVLAELEHQHARHDARLFVFTDLKLNSNVDLWRSLGREVQRAVPEARWIGAVHVGTRGDNGLSAEELRAARAAGMVRITTGVESGSQRLLDLMAKGTDLDRTSAFLADAHAAGISVRTTMFTGYPGEQAEDLDRTTRFLEQHERYLERVPMYRFAIMTGTVFEQQLQRRPSHFPSLADLEPNHRLALVGYRYEQTERPDYRRAVVRLFRVVHRINRRPLRPAARDFEGVM
ncbi:MAG: radical SAM protein [Gemmatimonadota bacterium]